MVELCYSLHFLISLKGHKALQIENCIAKHIDLVLKIKKK